MLRSNLLGIIFKKLMCAFTGFCQIPWIFDKRFCTGNNPMRKRESFVPVGNWLCTVGLWYCLGLVFLKYKSSV